MLLHRKVLKLQGSDPRIFLRKICTSDPKMHISHGGISGCGAMLNPQGKILFDVLYFCPPQEMDKDVLYLEYDQRSEGRLIQHLKKHRLRSKIEINRMEHLMVGVGDEQGAKFPGAFHVMEDPRNKSNLPLRIYGESIDVHPMIAKRYHALRMLSGVPEGVEDIVSEKSLVWESNYDLMEGVDLGFCFLGQELTARSYHTGVIRKRLVPVEPEAPGIPLPLPGTDIQKEGVKRRVGRMGSSIEELGLCVLPIDLAEEGVIFHSKDDPEARFRAVKSDTLYERIRNSQTGQ